MRRFEIPFPLLRAFCGAVLYPFFGFEIRGLEHLEKVRGKLIMAGNHTGYLDSGLILSACKRRFRFIMAEEVLGWGVIGKIVRHANVLILPKGNEKRALLELIRLLREDACICIFPEGRLTRDGNLQTFHEGVAFLQEKSGAPIIPFAILGGFEAWPEGRRWPIFRKVILQFGEPLLPDDKIDRTELTRLLKQKVQRMKDALDNRHRPLVLPVARHEGEPCSKMKAVERGSA